MIALVSAAVAAFVLDRWTKGLFSKGNVMWHARAGTITMRSVIAHRPEFSSFHARVLLLLWLVFSATCVILMYEVGFASTVVAAALGSAVGGAAGNALDMVRRQAVTDFICIGRWPPFNVADVAIVGGLIAAAALA